MKEQIFLKEGKQKIDQIDSNKVFYKINVVQINFENQKILAETENCKLRDIGILMKLRQKT
jgi:hypothetical protein